MVGILYATEYIPFMDAPHNNVTKYRSEDETIHHDNPENIVGTLNCSISFLKVLYAVTSLLLGVDIVFKLQLIKRIILKKYPAADEIRNPYNPFFNTTINKILLNMLTNELPTPQIVTNFIFSIPRV